MNKLKFIIILVLCVQCGVKDAEMIKEEKSGFNYWVNEEFLFDIFNSNMSVKELWEKHEYMMLYVDEDSSSTIIQSNIFHFGYDSQDEVALIKKENNVLFSDTSKPSIPNRLFTFEFNDTKLSLKSDSHDLTFKRFKFKKLKDEISSDIYERMLQLSSGIYTKYLIPLDIDSSHKNYPKYFLDAYCCDNTRAYCSDDYYYNGLSMHLNGELIHFNVVHDDFYAKFYEDTMNRARYEAVKYDSLPEITMGISWVWLDTH